MIHIRLLQAVIIAVPIVLFGWLLRQELVPSGVFLVEKSVDESSPFIDQLLPEVRVGEVETDADGDVVQAIVDDPVFFFVHPHRGFDEVEAEVWFKNDRVPIVELGGLAQEAGQVYDLKPLQNLLIDASAWERMESNGVTLLQRDPAYDSIADFLVNPPPRHEIATYHYTLARPYYIEGYLPSTEVRELDVSLRGFHEFKTYIKNERLQFTIDYMDMNRAEGADPVELIVFNAEGQPVGGAHLPDDGDVSAEAEPSSLRSLELSIPDLPEGVYKIELRAERDIFFRRITTTQQKIVFLNNLYVGDEVAWQEPARPVSFWTEAKNLAFQTQHAEGVQTVRVGNVAVDVQEPYVRYPVQVKEGGVVKVVAPKGDVLVHTDGHVAFTPEQFFNPDPIRLRETTDLDGLGVNYVIANYTSPEVRNGWNVARVIFDTNVLLLDEGTWKFAFSVPGIAQMDADLVIGKINMVWRREPLGWQDILEGIKHRL